MRFLDAARADALRQQVAHLQFFLLTHSVKWHGHIWRAAYTARKH
ncbi:hypothetical protein [Klebsiella pneumoniae IS53]|nr:hypothetical protein [Klebsiella pneumoniae IS53]